MKSIGVEDVLLLQAKINDNDDRDIVNFHLLVPSKIIGFIIGKSGIIINEIWKRTKADVRISKRKKLKCAENNDELFEVIGEVGSVRDALVQVVLRLRDDVLKDREGGRNPPLADSMYSGGGMSVHSALHSVPPLASLGFDQRVESGSGYGMLSSRSVYGYDAFSASDNGYGSYSSKAFAGLAPPSTVEMVIPGNTVGKVMSRGGGNIANIRKSLRFDFIKEATIDGIYLVDSKGLHMNIFSSTNMNFNSIIITAPANSSNTDGIHIGSSSFINILYSTIGTGDDCIPLGPGSNIYIANVTCGPGHGISIGSLGGTAMEEKMTGLIIKNCTLIGTTNGVRIKTWAIPYTSLVINLTFDQIHMNNVHNPIVIDQEYCPNTFCDHKATSHVQIRHIHYGNIWGRSTSKVIVNFMCSPSMPCQNIELKNIHLPYIRVDGPTSTNCSNVRLIYLHFRSRINSCLNYNCIS